MQQRQNPPGQPPVLPKVGPDISFYLLTSDGRRVLAAVGNDNGNAHYGYESMPQFQEYGSRECTNRKEMTSWLEMVMHESQLQATGAVAEEIAHLGEPTDDNPEGLYYVDVKCAALRCALTRPVRPTNLLLLQAHCSSRCAFQHAAWRSLRA